MKSARLPAWYIPEVGEARKARDNYKRLKQWPEYKQYRNKTRSLIRKAKRKHLTDAVEPSKNTSIMWKHLREVNKGSVSTVNNIPDELLINNEYFSDSHTIATKLNEYFSSIAQILNSTNTETTDLDLTKLTDFVNNKVPERSLFRYTLYHNRTGLIIYRFFGPI